MATATRMWALDGATFTLEKSMLMVGGIGQVVIPVPAYLIQHPRGLVLIDTGMDPRAVTDPEGIYGPLAAMLNMEFAAENTVDKQLQAIGFAPSDVTHVVISHTHFDHTGAMYLFPQADFFLGVEEIPYTYRPLNVQAAFYFERDVEAIRSFRIHNLPGDHDLFGDGSMQILSLPGHTPGHKGMLVRLPHRNVVLTGDAVHLREALVNEHPAPSDYSGVQAAESIRRLRTVALTHDAQILIHHDFDDMAEVRKLGEALV